MRGHCVLLFIQLAASGRGSGIEVESRVRAPVGDAARAGASASTPTTTASQALAALRAAHGELTRPARPPAPGGERHVERALAAVEVLAEDGGREQLERSQRRVGVGRAARSARAGCRPRHRRPRPRSRSGMRPRPVAVSGVRTQGHSVLRARRRRRTCATPIPPITSACSSSAAAQRPRVSACRPAAQAPRGTVAPAPDEHGQHRRHRAVHDEPEPAEQRVEVELVEVDQRRGQQQHRDRRHRARAPAAPPPTSRGPRRHPIRTNAAQ